MAPWWLDWEIYWELFIIEGNTLMINISRILKKYLFLGIWKKLTVYSVNLSKIKSSLLIWKINTIYVLKSQKQNLGRLFAFFYEFYSYWYCKIDQYLCPYHQRYLYQRSSKIAKVCEHLHLLKVLLEFDDSYFGERGVCSKRECTAAEKWSFGITKMWKY